MRTWLTVAAARQWMLTASCTALGAVAAAADPMKLPDPVAPKVSATSAPAIVSSAPCAPCDTCTDGGAHFSKHKANKAERKEIVRAAHDCASTPSRQVPPIGTFTREAFALQQQNALAEYLVIFTIEWEQGTADLNGYGMRHMDGITRRLGGHSHPVKIEPSGNQSLDELRKATIAQAAAWRRKCCPCRDHR